MSVGNFCPITDRDFVGYADKVGIPFHFLSSTNDLALLSYPQVNKILGSVTRFGEILKLWLFSKVFVNFYLGYI